MNFELPINGSDFDEVHIGKAGEILPELVELVVSRTLHNTESRDINLGTSK